MSKEMLSSINYSENRFLIDWFAFSSRIDSFESMAELLGMSHCDWQVGISRYGYTGRYYFEGVSIHWADYGCKRYRGSDKEEEVFGVLLEMSGGGCRAFETYGHGNWQKLLDYVVFNAENIVVSRFDIAYDDFTGLLDMDKIYEDTCKKNFVSKTRKCYMIQSFTADSEIARTVEHGTMKSDTYIRIYDKRLEQNAQEFTDHWVRNEIQLRHGNAFSAIALLCDEYEYKDGKKTLVSEKKPINEMYFMVMNNYLRYIEPSETDSNKWRAPLAEHWQKFAESVTTYRVSLWAKEGVDYNQGKLNNFVENMAGAAIFTYISIHGVDKLIDECNKKSMLLAPKYKLLLDNSMSDVDCDIEKQNLLDFNSLLDVGFSRPAPRLFTCISCRCQSIASDFVSYNCSSLTGKCYKCFGGPNGKK